MKKPIGFSQYLFCGSSLFAAPAVGVGIEIGAPPRPPVVRSVRPVDPGPRLRLDRWFLRAGRRPLCMRRGGILGAASVSSRGVGSPALQRTSLLRGTLEALTEGPANSGRCRSPDPRIRP